MPEIEEVAKMIEIVDLVLLSDYSCTHNSIEVLQFCSQKRVITTSSNPICGYNHFYAKEDLFKLYRDPEYRDAINNLCTLIKITLENQKSPHS